MTGGREASGLRAGDGRSRGEQEAFERRWGVRVPRHKVSAVNTSRHCFPASLHLNPSTRRRPFLMLGADFFAAAIASMEALTGLG